MCSIPRCRDSRAAHLLLGRYLISRRGNVIGTARSANAWRKCFLGWCSDNPTPDEQSFKTIGSRSSQESGKISLTRAVVKVQNSGWPRGRPGFLGLTVQCRPDDKASHNRQNHPHARTKRSGAIFSLRPVRPVSLFKVRGNPIAVIATPNEIRATTKRVQVLFMIARVCQSSKFGSAQGADGLFSLVGESADAVDQVI